MNAMSMTVAEQKLEWDRPARGRVGMFGLIAAEAAIFTIFVVAYLFYVGKSLTGPMAKDALSIPVFYTICLLSSSLTAYLAERNLAQGKVGAFRRWWLLTIALGAAFLFGTAREWRHLIFDEGLTITATLFGTTYYSLVGLHAFHVTAGLIALLIVSLIALLGHISREHAGRVAVLSLYWHFVDAVWIVVFTVVYVVGV